MTSQETKGEIRRILVALDASRDSRAALQAAAELAALLEAELSGLFVEDEDVFNLAGLPFAREFGYGGPGQRALDRATLERQFRIVAEEARRALERAAAARRVRWSFRVARGRVARELLNAALESDMVALGKAYRPLTRARRLGSAARAVAAKGPMAVLLTETGAVPGDHPVTVTYDDSACARRALAVAGRLAQRGRRTLDVLLLAADAERARALEEAVSRQLQGSGVAARFRTLPPGDAAALKGALEGQQSALLVLGLECYPLAEDELERLLGETGCPVLLIRGGEA